MAQNLNPDEMRSRDTAVIEFDGDSMKDCLRKAEVIRHSLEGRSHTDSTELIADDRQQ